MPYLPAVGQEGGEPVGVHVDRELGGKYDREEDIQTLKNQPSRGLLAIGILQCSIQLCLGCIGNEILMNRRQGVRTRTGGENKWIIKFI